VRQTIVTRSSTTCDVTLSYISGLTPSELHISQQIVRLKKDSKIGSSHQKDDIKETRSSSSYLIHLLFILQKWVKNPYNMTPNTLTLTWLGLFTSAPDFCKSCHAHCFSSKHGTFSFLVSSSSFVALTPKNYFSNTPLDPKPPSCPKLPFLQP
jgi:hypothetical protein